MISVEACEPELPPLEMISGMKSASTTRLLDLVLEEAHRRRGEHFAEEEHDQPDRALAHQLEQRRVHVGLVQRLDAAELLHVLGRLLLLHVEHVVDRHDAEQLVLRVDHRQRGAVVFLENVERRRLVVGRAQRDERVVVDLRDLRRHRARAGIRGCARRRSAGRARRSRRSRSASPSRCRARGCDRAPAGSSIRRAR